MYMYFIAADRSPVQNIAAVLSDWEVYSQSLPRGFDHGWQLRNRAFWGAVDAICTAAPDMLAVIATTRGWSERGVARAIVERRSAWT